MKIPESKIQQNIIQYLSMTSLQKNFVFFSVPNEGIMAVLKMYKIPDKQCFPIVNHFKKMGLLPGTSDIVLVHEGRAYFIEVKDVNGTQSQDQVRFEHNIVKAGANYAVVRSVSDVIGVLGEWGIV